MFEMQPVCRLAHYTLSQKQDYCVNVHQEVAHMNDCMKTDMSQVDASHSQGLAYSSSAPRLPKGFIAASKAVPLMGVLDTWWIVPVHSQTNDLDGLLIFEDRIEIVFLTAEEALTIGALVLEQLTTLLQHCGLDYLERSIHSDDVKMLVSAWWRKETNKTRTLVSGPRVGAEKETLDVD